MQTMLLHKLNCMCRSQEGEAVTPAQPHESSGPAGRPAHVQEPVTATRRDAEMQLTPFLAFLGVQQQVCLLGSATIPRFCMI